MTDDERAEIGRAHRTPPLGVAVDFDDATGKYDGDELREIRNRRPVPDRITRLEEKHDALVKEVSDTRREVANMAGKLEVLPELVRVVRDTAERTAQREDVAHAARVDVDKAKQLDALDAAKAKRWLYAKIAAALLGTGVLTKLLAHWGVL